MADEETDSARKLQEALDAVSDMPTPRRAKRPPRDEAALFELSFELPVPEVPWVRLDTFGDLSFALDEAREPLASRPPGTLYRITQGDRVEWLGVVAENGRVADAPRVLFNAPGKAPDWVSAWEGPDSKGDWMLRQAGFVERRLLVRAAVECVRSLVEASPLPEVAWRFRLVDEWLLSEPGTAPPERLELAPATSRTDDGGLSGAWGPDRVRRAVNRTVAGIPSELASLAAAKTGDAAGALARGLLNRALFALTFRGASDGSAAERSLRERVRRGFGREVRKTIPLGVLLLSRLPRRRRPTTARA